MSRPRPRRGYTIVELLVAIAIIGILSAILLAAVARSRAKARQIVCVNNLAQLYKYVIYYVDENEGLLPNFEGIKWIDDLIVLCPKPVSPDILKCPSDPDPMPASVYELSYACNCTYAKKRLTSIKKPSQIVLFTDIGRKGDKIKYCARYAWVLTDYSAFRHFDGLNAMFADGHIDSLRPAECRDEIFRPKP